MVVVPINSRSSDSHTRHKVDDAPTARDGDHPSMSKPLSSGLAPLPLQINDPDLCCTVGTNLSNQMMAIWQRGKARVSRLLDNAPPEMRTTHEPASYLPYEITEMIIAHLTHDLNTLKACSLTW